MLDRIQVLLFPPPNAELIHESPFLIDARFVLLQVSLLSAKKLD